MISIIMPVYNENINELNQSISSILSQTYKYFEFLILDDNPSSIKLHDFLLNVSKTDSRIKVIFNLKNLGLTSTVNKGIHLSNGRYIARMDADDICDKYRLIYQLKFLKKNDLDLVCSNYIGFNYNGLEKHPYYGDTELVDQNEIRQIFSRINIAIGPTIFFNRKIINKINGYRSIDCDDYDFVARALVAGYFVGYQPNVLLYKRNRLDNISNNNALGEFIATYFISKALRKKKYKKNVSIKQIYFAKTKISCSDIKKFFEFKKNFDRFKHVGSYIYLLKAIIYTFSSSLVLKRNIWMLFVNKVISKKV